MTALAYALDAKPFGFASVALALAVAFPVGAYEAAATARLFSPALTTVGLTALAFVALASEVHRLGLRRGLDFHQHPLAPYLLYGAVAALVGLTFCAQLSALNAAWALAGAAVVSGALVLVLHPTILAGICTAFLVAASAWCAARLLIGDVENSWRVLSWALVATALIAERFFSGIRSRTPIAVYTGAISTITAMAVLLAYLDADLPPAWVVPAFAVSCFAFCAYGALFRAPAAFAVGIAAALMASLRLVMESFQATTLVTGMVIGFVLLAVFWLAIERALAIFRPAVEGYVSRLAWLLDAEIPPRYCRPLPVIVTATLMLVMAYRIPQLIHANFAYITIGWFAIAATCFTLALAFRQADYRYTGLAVIVLSLARLFLIDMKEQDPLLRVAAFAVIGAGLLVISIGYYKWMARVRAEKREQLQQDQTEMNVD